MADQTPQSFHECDLDGADFDNVGIRRATFRRVTFEGSTFENVDFFGVTMRDVAFVDVDVTAEVRNFVINGVDVAAYVESEIDKQQPGREKMRPTTPEGFREAWDLLEEKWEETVAHARRVEAKRPGALHESVDGEWSFTQTLRHVVHATEVWVHRVMLGDPRPYHPLSLPFDEMTPHPEVPWDRDARPDLETVLAMRADRRATVRRVLEELTEEQLAGETEPVEGPAWPPARAFPVREVLLTVLNEEWEHRRYAERDLAVLEARPNG